MSDYEDNVDKLGSKSKTVAAILKKKWDDLVDERNELLDALKELLDVTGFPEFADECLFCERSENNHKEDCDWLIAEKKAYATIEKVTPKPNP